MVQIVPEEKGHTWYVYLGLSPSNAATSITSDWITPTQKYLPQARDLQYK